MKEVSRYNFYLILKTCFKKVSFRKAVCTCVQMVLSTKINTDFEKVLFPFGLVSEINNI